MRIDEISIEDHNRMETGFEEFDRLLGGGVVRGALTLIGGEPGIGKSTLLLQICERFAKLGQKVLYVSGEESAEQTSLRAKRLNISSPNLFILSETLFSNIKAQIDKLSPDLLIVDSVQIVYKGEIPSLPGSVTQVREIAMECMHIAKGSHITTFLVGHMTKSGEIAGPRLLEHLVDTVLEFEGDRQHGFRILRSVKNRFGPTDDIALFQMASEGLQEVPNPSEYFLQERQKCLPGSAIIPTIEGTRALMIEVQALIAASAFSTSTRRSTGLDQNRLGLLLAVLEKRLGYQLYSLDVYVSVAGGLKIVEPALDLGIIMAIASSFCNKAIDPDVALFGEVGLGGEVRSSPRVESRIKEAIHMGFKRVFLPKKNLKNLGDKYRDQITLFGIDVVEEAVNRLFV